jgi:hypothetical protein
MKRSKIAVALVGVLLLFATVHVTAQGRGGSKPQAPKPTNAQAPKPQTSKPVQTAKGSAAAQKPAPQPKANAASAKPVKTAPAPKNATNTGKKPDTATASNSNAGGKKKTTTTTTSTTTSTSAGTTTGGTTTGSTTLTPVQQKLQRNTNLASKLQSRLPAGTDLMLAAEGFRNLGQFVAAVNVSNNLNIPFEALRTKMVDEKMSLGQAIQKLKPTTVGTVEAQRADYEARGMILESESAQTQTTPTTTTPKKNHKGPSGGADE